jgi:putative ABC transport system substrate-binding protein
MRCGSSVLLPALLIAASAFAQTAPTVPHIGWLAWARCATASFENGLRDLGYVPGTSVVIECRSAGGRYERLPRAAEALVRRGVDVIVAASQPTAQAAHDATRTIPIVMIASGDPVASGLVDSLAHPGGNITGLSYYATELTAKRLELLREAVPRIARIGVLANPAVAYLPFVTDTVRAAATLGLDVAIHQVSEPAEIDVAVADMADEGADAVFVLPDLMLSDEAERIAAAALRHRLPTMAWGAWFTEAGCLIAYSAEYANMTRSLAGLVDRIIKGARPGDLPIDQPSRFRLSINQRTARALGIALPQSFVARVDEEIE